MWPNVPEDFSPGSVRGGDEWPQGPLQPNWLLPSMSCWLMALGTAQRGGEAWWQAAFHVASRFLRAITGVHTESFVLKPWLGKLGLKAKFCAESACRTYQSLC